MGDIANRVRKHAHGLADALADLIEEMEGAMSRLSMLSRMRMRM
jgi:hypothetical protein